MNVTVEIPERAEVSFKFEISAKANHKPKALVNEVNITPFVAKQSIDDFLLNSEGGSTS